MHLFSLENNKAIVTGGTRGLGKGMAEGLMEAGAEVVIMGSNEKVYDVAQEFCNCGFKCHGVVCDLRDSNKRAQGFNKAVEILGGLDIIVNAAGIQRRCVSNEFSSQDWNDVIEVNQNAVFDFTQRATNEFLKKEKPYGKVINITSMIAYFGGQTIPAYAASKGAVMQFTKTFCNDLAYQGINYNCIAPGYMATEMNAALTKENNPERYEQITMRIPARRWGTPEDMKGACVFLASHASDYVNGCTITVDGGYLVK